MLSENRVLSGMVKPVLVTGKGCRKTLRWQNNKRWCVEMMCSTINLPKMWHCRNVESDIMQKVEVIIQKTLWFQSTIGSKLCLTKFILHFSLYLLCKKYTTFNVLTLNVQKAIQEVLIVRLDFHNWPAVLLSDITESSNRHINSNGNNTYEVGMLLESVVGKLLPRKYWNIMSLDLKCNCLIGGLNCIFP